MKAFTLFIVAFLLFPWHAVAQTTQPAIAITTDVEDGKKMIHVVVTTAGKPNENVVLQYFVGRTFGNILIGEDTTLDDGSSAVEFPSDLPGGPDGQLHIVVRGKSPAQFTSASSSAAFAADVQTPAMADAFPRALWAPQAPIGLMLSIFAILAGVWLSYLFVVSQILFIVKGGQQ